MLAQEPIDLRVDDVTVVYNNGHIALHDASFSLNPGTICALVGINGSGKSTLFKAIMGFVKPVCGNVTIAGRSVHAAHKRQLVAYVPQTEEVDWAFPISVWDVVMMGRYGTMNFMRIPRAQDKAIAMDSLKRVDMLDYRHRQIGELSGGQKKRIFLARSLAQRGRILLLDEPFTGIDITTEAAIIDLLRELRDEGHLILISTHDLESIPTFCDQAILLNHTVLAAGPLATSFTRANLSRAFGGMFHSLPDEAAEQGIFNTENSADPRRNNRLPATPTDALYTPGA